METIRPKISVLSEETAGKILDEAVGVLQEPGVRVHNEEALTLLAEAGAQVDFSGRTACLPETLVQRALESVPSEFVLYSLDGVPAVHYGGDQVHFDPGSAGISLLDAETGLQRPAVSEDYVKLVQLVETLPELDAQSTALVCSDVVEEIGDLYRLYLALSFMNKPVITGAFRKDTWWVMRELLLAAAGGEDALAERPLAVFDVCPSPPLLWSDLTCQNLIDCARSRIPAQLVSMPLAGATAPVTLAAAVVQHTAESLSGLLIHQLAGPGAPLVWGGSPAAFDMRSGTTPMGAPETWLIDAAYVQIGKRLNLPTHAYMGMSDAKTLDAQCGFETMAGVMAAALAGVNMVSGPGMLDFETCISLEKLVIDAEIIGLVRRFIAGIQPREDPLALDLVRRMGHRGDYLSQTHTQRWFRKELHMPSAVVDRGPYETWRAQGMKTTAHRAAERVEALLQKYRGPTASPELRRELRRITQAAANRFGMEALPPLPGRYDE